MKVTLINTKDTGGAAKACLRLHKGLLQKNVNSNLILLNKKNKIPNTVRYKNKNFINRNINERIKKTIINHKVHQLKKKYVNLPIFSPPFSPYRLDQIPIVKNADIINIHWTNSFLDYPSFFSNNNKPIVWTLHDMHPFTGGNHYNIGFSDYRNKLNKTLNKNLLIKKSAIANKNIHIVSPSQWLLEKSKHSDLFNNFPHYLIPYSIDSQIFSPKTLDTEHKISITENVKTILFVAESLNNKRKGFSILLEALKYIKSNFIAICIGNKVDYLTQLPNIKQIGYISSEHKLSKWYASADLFVIPSIEDNLPNTVIESITCGTPVVGFNVGGIPDMIISGKNGLLCNELNSEELGKTIQKALEIEFDSKWIRKDAIRRYSLFVQANAYINLFNKILNKTI